MCSNCSPGLLSLQVFFFLSNKHLLPWLQFGQRTRQESLALSTADTQNPTGLAAGFEIQAVLLLLSDTA